MSKRTSEPWRYNWETDFGHMKTYSIWAGTEGRSILICSGLTLENAQRIVAIQNAAAGSYPAKVNELFNLLQSVRAEGRQEGFAEARKRAAYLCNQKAINCERRAASYTERLSILSAHDKQISFEEARDDIRTLQLNE